MPTLNYVDRDGTAKSVEAEAGLTVMEVIREHGVTGIFAICGGCCSCASCHVYVDADWQAKTGQSGDDEQMLLDLSDHVQDSSRLSCQIRVTDELDGLRVTVAPED